MWIRDREPSVTPQARQSRLQLLIGIAVTSGEELGPVPFQPVIEEQEVVGGAMLFGPFQPELADFGAPVFLLHLSPGAMMGINLARGRIGTGVRKV